LEGPPAHRREADREVWNRRVEIYARTKKGAGLANVQYRHRRFFILAASHGEHRFFAPVSQGGEGEHIHDCRKVPVKFGSYAISFRGGHAHVRIECETLKDLKAFFLDRACHWPKDGSKRNYIVPAL
jgi:hypothetical protein